MTTQRLNDGFVRMPQGGSLKLGGMELKLPPGATFSAEAIEFDIGDYTDVIADEHARIVSEITECARRAEARRLISFFPGGSYPKALIAFVDAQGQKPEPITRAAIGDKPQRDGRNDPLPPIDDPRAEHRSHRLFHSDCYFCRMDGPAILAVDRLDKDAWQQMKENEEIRERLSRIAENVDKRGINDGAIDTPLDFLDWLERMFAA